MFCSICSRIRSLVYQVNCNSHVQYDTSFVIHGVRQLNLRHQYVLLTCAGPVNLLPTFFQSPKHLSPCLRVGSLVLLRFLLKSEMHFLQTLSFTTFSDVCLRQVVGDFLFSGATSCSIHE